MSVLLANHPQSCLRNMSLDERKAALYTVKYGPKPLPVKEQENAELVAEDFH